MTTVAKSAICNPQSAARQKRRGEAGFTSLKRRLLWSCDDRRIGRCIGFLLRQLQPGGSDRLRSPSQEQLERIPQRPIQFHHYRHHP